MRNILVEDEKNNPSILESRCGILSVRQPFVCVDKHNVLGWLRWQASALEPDGLTAEKIVD